MSWFISSTGHYTKDQLISYQSDVIGKHIFTTYADVLDADYGANVIIGKHLQYNSVVIRTVDVLLARIVRRCKVVKKVPKKTITMCANVFKGANRFSSY